MKKITTVTNKRLAGLAKKHPRRVKAIPIVLIAIIGIVTILISQAATFSIAIEAETNAPTNLVINDSTASGGKAVVFGTGGGTGGTEPAGVFMTKAELARAKSRNGAAAPFGTGYSNQTSRANSALNQNPNPFYMEQNDYLQNIVYNWCGDGDTDNIDNSLDDAADKLERDGALTQTLGLQYALTGDTRYGDKAISFLKAWANRSTPVNMYDFHTDPITFNQSLRGESAGDCSDYRPWNFALDGLFQGYGLLGFSDAYVLLKNNGYNISAADQTLITTYIRKLTEAVNSSFHTWTRWADNHKSSSAYTRYRADNHLAWSLAPMLAASVALNDNALRDYCIDGGTWYDSRSGNYKNPSSIKNVIDLAILSDGRIIDPVQFGRPEAYTYFHLQAINITSQIAQASYGIDIWNYKGTDGAGLEKAYTSASTQVISGGFSGDSWQFEIPYNKWPTVAAIKSARDKGRTSYVQPGSGPVSLIAGQ